MKIKNACVLAFTVILYGCAFSTLTPEQLQEMKEFQHAFDWKARCEVDKFTDQKLCLLYKFNKYNNKIIRFTYDSNTDTYTFGGEGELSVLYDEHLLIRIDDNPVINLIDISLYKSFDTTQKFLIFLSPAHAEEILDELASGEILYTRKSTGTGYIEDIQYELDTFSIAHDEFKELIR